MFDFARAKAKYSNMSFAVLLCLAFTLLFLPQAARVAWAEEALDGCDFVVTGSADNYSWDEASGLLTITGGDVKVSNKDAANATSQRIFIRGEAHVTLDGVNISTGAGAPIEIRDYNDTQVTMSLSGSNMLVSQANDKAAIHKTRGQQASSSAAATLTIDGAGSLTAIGGSNAAGIGGGGWRGDVHNIIINGGTINATGTGQGAGIGSSNDGSTWNIVVNGGDITANGAPGIGANVDGLQGQKNAAITGGMVVASSYKGTTPAGGLVSTDGGKEYAVYSDVALSKDLEIQADGKLTVAEGAKLTVAEGATLTNKGSLVNNGTVSGSLVNEGSVYNKGTLPSGVGGNVYEQCVAVNNGRGSGNYSAGATVAIAANAPAAGKMFSGWTVEVGDVALADSSKLETTFTMPDGCVVVTANYVDIAATVTDANGNVSYYADDFRAQHAWRELGGTLTVYADDFHLEDMFIPQDGVLDLNGHSVTAFELRLRNDLTIKNGTLAVELEAWVSSDAVLTFENVSIKSGDNGAGTATIRNEGTIVSKGKGLALDGVAISGGTVNGTVKTVLNDGDVTLAGIPDKGFVYDGTARKPSVVVKRGETILAEGTDYTVEFSHSDGSDNLANAGTVTVTVTGIGNYGSSVQKTYDIAQADPGIGKVSADVINDTLETSAIVLTRKNDDVAGSLTVDAGQVLALGENEIAYTFVPASSNYKTVTGTVAVTVADTIAPTGAVALADDEWTGLVKNVTFGRFYNEAQTVSVVAEDSLSGVAKVEYLESSVAMDMAALREATQWAVVPDGGVSVALEDGKQFVCYIRITDNSGNVSYLSTNGAQYDITAPAISGVEDGAIYSSTQKVAVTDRNIESITLNGKEVGKSFVLDGSKEAVYTIVATDKAGNSTSVTVTMKPSDSSADKTDDDGRGDGDDGRDDSDDSDDRGNNDDRGDHGNDDDGDDNDARDNQDNGDGCDNNDDSGEKDPADGSPSDGSANAGDSRMDAQSKTETKTESKTATKTTTTVSSTTTTTNAAAKNNGLAATGDTAMAAAAACAVLGLGAAAAAKATRRKE